MGFAAALIVAGLIAAVGIVQFVMAARGGNREVEEMPEAQISADYGPHEHNGLHASRASGVWLLLIATALAGAVLAGLTFEVAVSAAVLLVLLPTVIAFSARFIGNRVNRSL